MSIITGVTSAASEDLAAKNCLDSDTKRIPSESEGESVTEIPSESKGEAVPAIPSQSERDPVPEILSKSERDSGAESDDWQQRLPGSSLYGKNPRRWSRKEEWLDAERDDCQQRLPGSSLYGKSPRRWSRKEEWVKYIEEDPDVRPRSRSDATIFKIPNLLKDTKREAYVPQMVSLGPYHHGSAKLSAMDHYKGRALHNMMTRFNINTNMALDDVTFAKNAWDAILERKDEISDSYEESIYCTGNTLNGMLCLDGCFILEVLKTMDGRRFLRGKISDPIFGENMVAASNILKDILMLENQLPLIVLLELLKLENSQDNGWETLLNVMVKGTCGLFKMSSKDRAALLGLDWAMQLKPADHLLAFVHKVIVHRPCNQANPGNQGACGISIKTCIDRCLKMLPDENEELNEDFESIPRAVELNKAGIKFQPCDGGIKQIKFDKESSTIYLPLLSITYDTEVLFRNLIAFEMCRSSEGNFVTSYVNLMDDLIDSQKDVAFLRSMGILTNLIGSDQEVAELFNGIFKGVTVRVPNMFNELRKEVNANYKNRIRVQLEELRRDHFSSPWKAIALAVASAILCLTLIETIYTVKQYLQCKQ